VKNNLCDSIITLHLKVFHIAAQIGIENNVLFVTDNDDYLYQWYDCIDQELIIGENNSSFSPTTNGSYACIIDNNGCLDTTECISFVSTTSEENLENFHIMPNPNDGNFVITANDILVADISIFDKSGKKIKVNYTKQGEDYVVNNEFISGVYFVIITTEDSRKYYRKIVVVD
jgi:hypothetical protein